VMMGGRAAERLIFGNVSSGAQNDLQQATALARRMVEQFGMSGRVGPIALSTPGAFLDGEAPTRPHPSGLSTEADEEVREILRAADDRAQDLLAERREDLERLAAVLLERETIEGHEPAELLAGGARVVDGGVR